CPTGDARCAGSPWGDNWTTWAADFFTPGAPLLAAAPWVIVRGNHEECARAGTGFLRFLGPSPVTEGAPCVEHLAPYPVPLGLETLIVMDNANAVDRGGSDELVQSYAQDFKALAGSSPEPVWLAMHHPIWGVARFQFGIVVGGNTTLEDAEETVGIPSNVDLMLAGHIHTFEAINYAGGLPPQLIVGEGGDLLDDAPPDLGGRRVGNAKIESGLSLPGYGFLLMTHEGERWNVDVFNAAGERERNCTVATRSINCPKN
ncbi:MAG TPA: metallophosphoesterase, partial [Rhizomicrobium sp.]|nr:metallophosphoesterase [Rhizomicrobium sp.]